MSFLNPSGLLTDLSLVEARSPAVPTPLANSDAVTSAAAVAQDPTDLTGAVLPELPDPRDFPESGGTPARAGRDDAETALIDGAAALLAQGVSGLDGEETSLLTASLAQGFREGAQMLPSIPLHDSEGGTPTLPASLHDALGRAYPNREVSPQLLAWFIQELGLDINSGVAALRITTDNDPSIVDVLLGDNSDEQSPVVTADLAALEAEIAAGTTPSARALMSRAMAATGSPSSIVPSAIKAVLGDKFKSLKDLWGPSPSSGRGGMLAHILIQGHYLATHPGERILIEGFPSPAWSGTYTPWGLSAPDRSQWLDAVLLKLFDIATLGKPDILNEDRHEVYEIKPLDGFIEGASQLYAKYLLPLNIAMFAGATDPVAAARQFISGIGLNGQSAAGTPMPTGNLRPYLPGTEYVPPAMLPGYGGTIILVVRPLPGLILYKYWAPDRVLASRQQVREALKDVKYVSRVITACVGAAALHPNTDPGVLGQKLATAPGANPVVLAAAASVGTVMGAITLWAILQDLGVLAYLALALA